MFGKISASISTADSLRVYSLVNIICKTFFFPDAQAATCALIAPDRLYLHAWAIYSAGRCYESRLRFTYIQEDAKSLYVFIFF